MKSYIMKLLNILQEYSIPRSLEGFNLNMFQWEWEWRSTVLSPNQMFKRCLMMFATKSTILGGRRRKCLEVSASFLNLRKRLLHHLEIYLWMSHLKNTYPPDIIYIEPSASIVHSIPHIIKHCLHICCPQSTLDLVWEQKSCPELIINNGFYPPAVRPLPCQTLTRRY